MKISLLCPICNSHFSVVQSADRKTEKCPACGVEVLFPNVSAHDSDDAEPKTYSLTKSELNDQCQPEGECPLNS